MRNFDEALAKLNGRDRCKLENNTYLERLTADEIGVKLHSTIVVRYHRNGSVKVYSGGWHTVTTKARINDYSLARIHQRKSAWYFANGEPFTEGAEVGTPNGTPVQQPGGLVFA